MKSTKTVAKPSVKVVVSCPKCGHRMSGYPRLGIIVDQPTGDDIRVRCGSCTHVDIVNGKLIHYMEQLC